MGILTPLRLRLLAYAGAVLLSGGVVGWSLLSEHRGHGETVLVLALQRVVLERSLLRDEFFLHGEERPRAQWHEHTARIGALVAQIRRGWAGDPAALGSLERLDELLRRSEALFAMLEGTKPPGQEAAAYAIAFDGRVDPRAALRERAQDDLILVSFQTYSEASQLAELAVAHARGGERLALALVGVVVLAAMAAVIGVTSVTSTRTARRIARLEEGANRIAAGELGHRIRLPGADELAGLGRSFDGMAERLGATIGQLEDSNRELEAFSYSVSHDLRAPLRHVSGFVDLLSEHAAERLDARSLEYLAVIRRAAQNMGQLIDDLLAFSRIGRAPLAPGPVQLRPMIDEIVAELSGTERHAPEVVWRISELPEVVADAAMLRLVWTNLIDNALKFTRDRPVAHVEIGARDGAGGPEFFVKDDGVGFDMRYAGQLFGVFQRVHRQDEFEGTGVGLANVKRIVLRHGGRVGAEARVGEGATFWFSLPRSPGGGPPAKGEGA